MVTRKWLLVLSLLVVLGLVPLLSACESIPESAKPDVHLTFDIHADGSNQVMLEVAVHPLVDPLLRSLLTEARRVLTETIGGSVDLRETKRDGRAYNTLVLEFDSIADLNAFVNTPQLLGGIISQIVPDVTIPSPFADFEVWHDPDSRSEAYGLRARLDPATTAALQSIHLTTHVILPGRASEHNASSMSDRTLNWEVVPGQQLEVLAVADRLPPSDSFSTPIIVGATLGLVVLLALGGYWLWQRNHKNGETELDPRPFDDW